MFLSECYILRTCLPKHMIWCQKYNGKINLLLWGWLKLSKSSHGWFTLSKHSKCNLHCMDLGKKAKLQHLNHFKARKIATDFKPNNWLKLSKVRKFSANCKLEIAKEIGCISQETVKIRLTIFSTRTYGIWHIHKRSCSWKRLPHYHQSD